MKTAETFHRPLAPLMADFIAFKRMQGYDYLAPAGARQRFADFRCAQGAVAGRLHAELVGAYLATTAGLAPSTRAGRLSVVRQFGRYLHSYYPASALVPTGLLPRRPRNLRFCRLEPEQVRALMAAALELRPAHGIRPPCLHFLIGLLYATGLRIAEALKLDLGDFDPDQSTLFVRRGKFGKDRLVALSRSTRAALDGWLDRRSPDAADGPSAPLLVGAYHRRLTCDQAAYGFRTRCRRNGRGSAPAPRIHDLRHNFACRCLPQWRESGLAVPALLPALATAMGHVNFFATQVYLHVDALTLQPASNTFRQHFSPPPQEQP